jgi:hypothetical protein
VSDPDRRDLVVAKTLDHLRLVPFDKLRLRREAPVLAKLNTLASRKEVWPGHWVDIRMRLLSSSVRSQTRSLSRNPPSDSDKNLSRPLFGERSSGAMMLLKKGWCGIAAL